MTSRIVSEDIFSRKGKGGGQTKYDYEDLMDGKPHIWEKGKHFDVKPINAITAIRHGIGLRGYLMRATVVSETEIALQVYINGYSANSSKR